MTREAFKKVFDQHFDDIRNYIYFRSGDTDMATDIAQDAFLKLWEKRSKVYPGKEKGWLYKIAGDLFVSQYRRKQFMSKMEDGMQLEVPDASPEETMVFEELKQKYEKVLGKLPEQQRVVFLMSRVDDLKYHEIAERLGISIKAVEKRMSAALARFRSSLK